MGIREQIDLDEFFDRVGHNSSSAEGAIRVCRRIVYGETCDTFITTDPSRTHEVRETCGRMAVLCTGCSVLREDDTCVEFEPRCRFNVAGL
jgi:hypothetical protein